MGACDFTAAINATSVRAGFETLVEEAREMYGYDSYNGTISTTSLRGNGVKIADKFSKTAEKKAYKLINERIDHCPKWECRAIDCGVVEYRVITMKKDTSFSPKAPAKYQTRFILCDSMGNQVGTKSYANQTEAKAAMLRMFTEGKIVSGVYIAKKPVLVSGAPELACFIPVVKTYKNRPKSVPKDALLEEVHHYVYYGLAAC